jgi:Flp pilus assembly protein TadD
MLTGDSPHFYEADRLVSRAASSARLKAADQEPNMPISNIRVASWLTASVLLIPLAAAAAAPDEKPAEPAAVETKPVETKPAEKKPTEKKPTEKKPTEKKPAEFPAKSDKSPKADDGADQATDSTRRIAQLIKQLGDDDFFVRERAQQELAQIGIEAFDALSEAENQTDLEIADRARYLIRSMNLEWTTDSETPEVKRKLENYGSKDEKQRATVIDELGAMPDGQAIGVLARLVRFERSALLSKRAALAIIEYKPADERHWAARAAAIREGIGHSPRPAARWLLTYLAGREGKGNPPGAWAELATEETRTLHEHPDQSRPNLVIGLWRQEVDNLERLDRHGEAEEAMRRMASIDPEDNLNDLLNWLVEHKAWSIVDEVARRYADRFEQEPMLLYTLAQACAAQGNSKLASETAARALKLNPKDQRQHLIAAIKLKDRGLFDWSESEYRASIEIGPPGRFITVKAQGYLAEMLHDEQKDLAAAEVLSGASQDIEKALKDGQSLDDLDVDPKATRSRMHYFYACHEASLKHRDKQIEQLLKGLEQDSTDADILIALYRLPGLPAPLRARTVLLIKEAVEQFRGALNQSPDNSIPYNQLAWLVANTEGDKQEALRCSQRSLELRPNEAGYLDTMGRCYWALGELANAVKFQSQAVAIDKHNGQLKRQLDFFRAELAKSQKKKADAPATQDAAKKAAG